ncbi:toll-like receptor 13 isoform X1 [Micropterus dolomieu]|uniref:toll-like receptor 13 isoform X1 n=1 Tax=Micropterus dolomieu TaxID=147949 RepID=UPI001E8ECF3F|nr:toll-like receptor 13 isoform X1 [Micropterus dolomieu]XP_045890763.1 toll-like receptor 13 isoform X1 [Micropterus dolomieu]
MGPGVNKEKMKPRGGSKCYTLSVTLLLWNINRLVIPVEGFSLRSCRISYNNAICTKSKLTAVPQDIPPTVQGLDLSANQLIKIQSSDFKHLALLTQLDLNRNRISKIDTGAFANLISLKKLNLNNNKLDKLVDNLFDGLRNLMELRINNNHINSVGSATFTSLRSLRFLDISYNKLRSITKFNYTLQYLPNLRVLSIKNNDLTVFNSWQLTNRSLPLTSLDLSQNSIAAFRITADVFPNLTWFNMGASFKKHKMIWDVRNETFLSQVSTLDISGLHLPDDIKAFLGSFSSLTSLRMNGMKRNRLPALINISCTIPSVTTLQLRSNNLTFVDSDMFQLCINVTELDLTSTYITNIQDEAFRSIRGLRILSLSRNRIASVPAATRNIPTLSELDLSANLIASLGCHDFANLTKLRQLNLYNNKISALQECLFKDLIGLQVLKLQNNQISILNGAFKKYLPNLRRLHLNENKLTAIEYGDFQGLKSLQNLSLHQNQIQSIKKGSFIGLTSLTDIQLQNNDIKQEEIKTCFNVLTNLRRLELRDNHIKYKDSSALPNPPFSQLSLLETLAIPAQHYRGRSQLPRNFLQGLTNLLVFNIRNIQLLYLHKDMFNYTPRLQTLDISSNELKDLSPDLFSPIRSLKSLYISRTNLQSLDFFIEANLTNLEFLQARKNMYSVISEEVIKSLPALIYMDFQGNSFTCDCDNAWFLQWAQNNTYTQVFDAYNFGCNYPPDYKDTKLLDLNINSCSVSIDFIYFVSITSIILLFMVASFTCHFLRWQLVYAYYYFLALLFDTKHRNKQAPYQYDAFISYNNHDEPWVIRELLPKLEGEQGWRLCLHHRDFEPGRPIIDNITNGIYGSRKTICVISRRYLESEWCSREIQAASFRLFDEKKDVLILVFLEEIPTFQLSPFYRMRKMLKRRTYLSWPRAGERTELFWKKLCQALKSGEDHGEDRFRLTVVDRP